MTTEVDVAESGQPAPPAPTTWATVSRVALAKLLDAARCVVSERSYKAIMRTVLLEASDGTLRMQATNGEMSLNCWTPAEGKLALCAAPFSELLKRVKAGNDSDCLLNYEPRLRRPLNESEPGSPPVDFGSLTLSPGRVTHRLETADSYEFPVIPTEAKGAMVCVNRAALVRACKPTIVSAALERTRYAIDAVLIDARESVRRLVGTDGRRMAIAELVNADGDFKGTCCVPVFFLNAALKLANGDVGDIAFVIDRRASEPDSKSEEQPPAVIYAFSVGGNWLLSTIEAEGSFPEYERCVPEANNAVAIDRGALLAVTEEVLLSCEPDNPSISLGLSSRFVTASTKCIGSSEAYAELPCSTIMASKPDAEHKIRVNPYFLRDALRTLEGRTVAVRWLSSEEYENVRYPLVIEDEFNRTITWVVMPLKDS